MLNDFIAVVRGLVALIILAVGIFVGTVWANQTGPLPVSLVSLYESILSRAMQVPDEKLVQSFLYELRNPGDAAVFCQAKPGLASLFAYRAAQSSAVPGTYIPRLFMVAAQYDNPVICSELLGRVLQSKRSGADYEATLALIPVLESLPAIPVVLQSLVGLCLFESGNAAEARAWLAAHEAGLSAKSDADAVFPLLEYAQSSDESLLEIYGALFKGARAAADSRQLLLRHALRYEATPAHEKLYAGALGYKLVSLALQPAAGASNAGMVEMLYRFKVLLARKNPELAWQVWLALSNDSKGNVFAVLQRENLWRNSQDCAGLLKDVYNAGRLAGQLSACAEVLDAAAQQLGGVGAAYAWELSARLYRAADKLELALVNGSKAHELAQGLVQQGLMKSVDEQRMLWYRMRTLLDAKRPDLSSLRTLSRYIADKEYFADLYENLLVDWGSGKRWDLLYSVFVSMGDSMSPLQNSRYALVIGRYYQLLGVSKRSAMLKEQGRKLIELVRKRQGSLVFHALAAAFLGRDPDLAAVLKTQQANINSFGGETAWGEQVYLDIARLCLQYGLQADALEYFVQIRKKMKPADFEAAAAGFQALGVVPAAVKMLDYERSYFGHPEQPGTLRRMYPLAFGAVVQKAAGTWRVPVELMFSLLRTESHFDEKVFSWAGAQGIAQFMPATAKAVAATMKLAAYDVLDANDAIAMSAFHMRELQDGLVNWTKTLAAYNAGRSRVLSWKKTLPADVFLFNELLPFTETRDYVRRILESALVYRYLEQGSVSQAYVRSLLQ